MEQAPQVVGTDLWQQCDDRQREEAVRQAAAARPPIYSATTAAATGVQPARLLTKEGWRDEATLEAEHSQYAGAVCG